VAVLLVAIAFSGLGSCATLMVNAYVEVIHRSEVVQTPAFTLIEVAIALLPSAVLEKHRAAAEAIALPNFTNQLR